VHVGDVLGRYPAAAAFVITDIARDGTLEGPDLAGLATAIAATDVPVIASGGVGTLADVIALGRIVGLAGVITGKALYERRFTVAEALAALQEVPA
jgi:phosphoribosylformimino-5-aminoimidazole carboxamide ribonucleotide (ProFAR) isomerase